MSSSALGNECHASPAQHWRRCEPIGLSSLRARVMDTGIVPAAAKASVTQSWARVSGNKSPRSRSRIWGSPGGYSFRHFGHSCGCKRAGLALRVSRRTALLLRI